MIHLRMTYGCDLRYYILQSTLKICYPYFDTVKVIATCNENDFEDIKVFESISNNIEIKKWNGNYYGDYEVLSRCMMWDVPENDWVHVLDSDERPTFDCLTSLKDIINDSENNNNTMCRLPSVHHLMDGSKDPIITLDSVYSGSIPYAEPSIFKYNIRKLYYLSSYGGGHSMPNIKNSNSKLYIKPTLHLKNNEDWNQSLTLQGFFNPKIHSSKNEKLELEKSVELYNLELLKKETGCYISNQLMDNILNENHIKEKFKELFLTYKNSKFDLFQAMFRWAQADLSPYVKTIPKFCGKKCCKYGDVQL